MWVSLFTEISFCSVRVLIFDYVFLFGLVLCLWLRPCWCIWSEFCSVAGIKFEFQIWNWVVKFLCIALKFIWNKLCFILVKKMDLYVFLDRFISKYVVIDEIVVSHCLSSLLHRCHLRFYMLCMICFDCFSWWIKVVSWMFTSWRRSYCF